MTKEEQAALEAKKQAEVDAKAKDEESAKDETKEEESEEEDESKDPDKIDYEAELLKEREAREKAEKAAADTSFKLREQKRKGKDEEDDEEEEEVEKPLTASQLQTILAKEREETTKSLNVQRIAEIAGKLATSESERNLLIEIHKNRSFPQHLSLEEQLEEAYAIANRKKLVGERNEALRALRGKDGVNDNPASTHQDAPKSGEPKIDAVDLQAIKEVGYSFNNVSHLYEKKLPNGNTITYNPKTKQTILVKK